MDLLEFRKAVYAYIQANKADFEIAVQEQIRQCYQQALEESEEHIEAYLESLPPKLHLPFIQWRLQTNEEAFQTWLEKDAFGLYVTSMQTCAAYGGEVEIGAISKLTEVPIRVFMSQNPSRPFDTWDTEVYKDLTKQKILHIIRPRASPHFDYMRVKNQ